MLRTLNRSTGAVLSGCCLLAAMAFTVRAQTLTFTTLAGTARGAGSADGTGSAARFFSPRGVATDSGGNVYVADTSNHAIRKITPAAVVTTLAGLAGVSGSADGVGGAALFNFPMGVATDSRGNVYVADKDNHTIRKITPAGVVTTLAGWAGIPGSAEGTGSAARFNGPQGLATDGGGNVYVADSGNHTIRKITPAGVVTTLAGMPGEDGRVDGTGNAARFNRPVGLAFDSNGNVFVADPGNQTMRRITPAGVVTTLAGSAGQAGFPVDGTDSAGRFRSPGAVAVDSGGNLYVADFSWIRKITPAGAVTTVAGWTDRGVTAGMGNAAQFNFDSGVAIDNTGSIYVADARNSTIRKITPAGVMTTLAGSADFASSEDGTGNAARFNEPTGVASDNEGNVYVADTRNHTIRKITRAGVVTTLAGSADSEGSADGTGSAANFRAPSGVAIDSGNVYVTDTSNPAIRKITPAGVVTTMAGAARAAYSDPENGSADGTGSDARFSGPGGAATDGGGNVYVADTGNNTIRKITPAGVVTTLAGTAEEGGSGDGTGGDARFSEPGGAATDGGGNVYVTDKGNNTIRKITPAGVVTTLAGSAGERGSGADGIGSSARFNKPSGVATDGGGNVYVTDKGNHTIRKITPAGVVTTVAGSPGLPGSADGVGSAARFNAPAGVAIDSAGTVYVADTGNHSIRIGKPTLADAATIDSSTGAAGVKRQLATTPPTATSWQWRIVRQPSGSTAKLSSTSIRNPVFTPDVADLYIFQLTASNGANTSITTVSLTATTSASPSAARSVP